MVRATPDYDADKRAVLRAKHLIEQATSQGGYEGLCDERSAFIRRACTYMEQTSSLTDQEAVAVLSMALNALAGMISQDVFSRKKDSPLSLTDAAATTIVSALEFLVVALPGTHTMVKYRNRRGDFVSAIADEIVDTHGRLDQNEQFYLELGRAVSCAVLGDRNVVPLLTDDPAIGGYSRIEQAAMEQVVYFIGAGETGPIKIGIARDPQARLSTFQTGHFERLTILALTTGGRELESAYHKRFAEHRKTGEWFTRCPEIEAEIARLSSPIPDTLNAGGCE